MRHPLANRSQFAVTYKGTVAGAEVYTFQVPTRFKDKVGLIHSLSNLGGVKDNRVGFESDDIVRVSFETDTETVHVQVIRAIFLNLEYSEREIDELVFISYNGNEISGPIRFARYAAFAV